MHNTISGTASAPTLDQDRLSREPVEQRRDFLRATGGGILAAVTAMGTGGLFATPSAARAEAGDPGSAHQRRAEAFRIRGDAARLHLLEQLPRHENNGDETLYDDRRASFSKCLPQNDLGEADLYAYAQLLKALDRGSPADFEAIPLAAEAKRKLANPQAAHAFDLMARDAWSTLTPPAPAFASTQLAAEMGEVYWQALTRDVPFAAYPWDARIAAAAADLNQFTDIRAPTEDGRITPGTLFRGGLPGDLVGPYLSQFLWQPIPYGASLIEQRYAAPTPVDFMIDYDEWLAIQRGAAPTSATAFDPEPRYISSGRALAEYVHNDALFQAYFSAALIISGFGPDALDRGNPYLYSDTQAGFATFGAAHLFDMVSKSARLGLLAAWFHKWLVHRRLRAEVFAARVENQRAGIKNYGINPEILESNAVARMLAEYGTALLPQAYPEGSPTHPAYPAGHSTVAGACATVLKAFVNEAFVIPDAVQASADGLSLEPWAGTELTLGHEINKLAANVSIGRCTAGVHYRSDGAGLAVGEVMAIGLLQDYSLTYNERFDGFSLTLFDGRRVRIVGGEVMHS